MNASNSSSSIPGPQPLSPVGSKASVHTNEGVKIVKTCTVHRPAADLYQFFRNPENLARVIGDSVAVERRSNDQAHWAVTLPFGGHIEWDAAIINDHPNELIAWRSLDGADLANAGTVRFAPHGSDTDVTVAVEYALHGKLAGFAAKLSRLAADHQVENALGRFKQQMEREEN